MLRVPSVVGVAEARKQISRIMKAIEQGETFLIKGSEHREALLVNPEEIRKLQDAYLDLVGELETLRVLQDDEAMRALRAVASGTPGRTYALDEVEGFVTEDEEQ